MSPAEGLSALPLNLGYSRKSFSLTHWVGNLEGRLLQSHVYRVARIWG